jgi:hypothetical protein
MTLPGFTAEASLDCISNRYMYSLHDGTEQIIYPANYTDQSCLRRCTQDCGSVCAGMIGQGKSLCIRECANENAECSSSCQRPGDPPPLPGQSVTGLDVGILGDIAMRNIMCMERCGHTWLYETCWKFCMIFG